MLLDSGGISVGSQCSSDWHICHELAPSSECIQALVDIPIKFIETYKLDLSDLLYIWKETLLLKFVFDQHGTVCFIFKN